MDLPDLILVDGGKGQLSAACGVLTEIEMTEQPIAALAKRLDEVFVPGVPEPQNIPRTSSGLKLLQQIRDEAHRFAITFHRELRKKRTILSELDKIDGIGPAKRSALLLIVFLALSPPSWSEMKGNHVSQATRVSDIRSSVSAERVRVVLDLDGPVAYTENRLSNPDRLYFDLSPSILPVGFRTKRAVDSTAVRGVRVAQFDRDTVRLVIELGAMESYHVTTLDNRLVIDIEAIAPSLPEPKAAGYTIVLDPGHGGEDPGAIGPGGIAEKNVVLDVAKRLRQRLASHDNVRIVLTRETDVFVPLLERTRIANREDADLFVSLHVNAVDGRRREKVRGVETYLLNWTNTKEARRVAERENRILVRAGERQPDTSALEMIFSDLARVHKRDESLHLSRLGLHSWLYLLPDEFSGCKMCIFPFDLFPLIFPQGSGTNLNQAAETLNRKTAS